MDFFKVPEATWKTLSSWFHADGGTLPHFVSFLPSVNLSLFCPSFLLVSIAFFPFVYSFLLMPCLPSPCVLISILSCAITFFPSLLPSFLVSYSHFLSFLLPFTPCIPFFLSFLLSLLTSSVLHPLLLWFLPCVTPFFPRFLLPSVLVSLCFSSLFPCVLPQYLQSFVFCFFFLVSYLPLFLLAANSRPCQLFMYWA